ncbi:hypothetical protein HED63_05240 [Ochrobactrum cytisi]|nr:hypothetical protein [Brucella cytisi]
MANCSSRHTTSLSRPHDIRHDPEHNPGARWRWGTKYFFDAEFPNGLKIYRMRLAETRNGLRVFGPKDNFGYSVTLPISLADELVVLAKQEAVARYGRS